MSARPVLRARAGAVLLAFLGLLTGLAAQAQSPEPKWGAHIDFEAKPVSYTHLTLPTKA